MSKTARTPVAITGFGWEIPALGDQATLSEALQRGPINSPVFAPEMKLGKKGLRYKERATLLALCAARSALQHAGLIDEEGSVNNGETFGVVIASNTGNLDTVCRAADIIRGEHVNATSPMDLPNASSNVVASTIAIRFGLKAINLMICSGASASLDALIVAANAIRNGRARRILVGSVESDGLALRSLLARERLQAIDGQPPVLEGAATVILESIEAAAEREAHVHGRLSDYAFAHAAGDQEALYQLFERHHHKSKYLPASSFLKHRSGLDDHVLELGTPIDQSYGSAALLQLIHACEQLQGAAPVEEFNRRGNGAVVVAGGNWLDQRAGALVVERQTGAWQ